jgi:hypothetical protein
MDARTATAADFDAAAQKQANASWFFLLVAIAVWYFKSIYWAIIPAVILLITIAQSVHATRMGQKLRDGTYPLPNPNNGAPDGDASNYSKNLEE